MTNINKKPRNIWFISDTHFSHANILKFTDSNKPDNPLIRPGFANPSEMDELMISNWNEVIKDGDKVYHLGDVGFAGAPTIHRILPRLKGKKRLVLGNHDGYGIDHYTPYFKIQPCWKVWSRKDHGKNFVCTHVPIHMVGVDHRQEHADVDVVYNVHGHIHQNLVLDKWGNPDRRYVNVCVEHTNYKPVHMDDLLALMK